MSDIIIMLDCPPGPTRPDAVLNIVLKNTELTINDFNVISKCYGEWTFKLNENKQDIYNKYEEIISKQINEAYDKRLIRYAEW